MDLVGLRERIGTAPISWGVCEVPGWGAQLPPERVLDEMADLGFSATELGSLGYFPTEPNALEELLSSRNLSLIGGFVPLVLHDAERLDATWTSAREAAELLAGGGGEFFITSPISAPDDWANPGISADEQSCLAASLQALDGLVAEYGLTQTMHPHLGTMVETEDEIRHVLDNTDISLCVDTGHFTLGGFDPLQAVTEHRDRVGLVHLKDVDPAVGARFRSRELSLMEAVQAGMFPPLGRGDVAIDQIVTTLESSGYQSWYVIEQDTALTTGEPPAGSGPKLDVQKSVEYLRSVESALATAPEAVQR